MYISKVNSLKKIDFIPLIEDSCTMYEHFGADKQVQREGMECKDDIGVGRPRRRWSTNQSSEGGCGKACIGECRRQRDIHCGESFPGTLKFVPKVQSRERMLGFLLLASVREDLASNSALLLLICTSHLATTL
jgi:hypothetical protein